MLIKLIILISVALLTNYFITEVAKLKLNTFTTFLIGGIIPFIVAPYLTRFND